MGRTFPKEIKNYAISHRSQGKTLKQIQQFLHMKGYDVSELTISSWMGKTDVNTRGSISDCSRYDDAIRYQGMKQEMFYKAKVGSKITVLIEVSKETNDGRTFNKKENAKVLVEEKYTHFLICTDGINKFCVDKMDIVSV